MNLLAAIAQFEREMMLERQREGMAKAQSKGVVRVARSRRPFCWPVSTAMADLAGNALVEVSVLLTVARK
jgi:hypothetical protein